MFGLVVLDPISAYLGDTDSHVNAKVRGLLAPLAELARGLGVAVVAVDHLSKSNRPALYRSERLDCFHGCVSCCVAVCKESRRPSSALDAPRQAQLSARSDGLSYTLTESKPGIGAVTWGGPVSMSADAVLQNEPTEQRSERLEAMDWFRVNNSSQRPSFRKTDSEGRVCGRLSLEHSAPGKRRALASSPPRLLSRKAGLGDYQPAEDAHQTPNGAHP